jgi:hypothetical protein
LVIGGNRVVIGQGRELVPPWDELGSDAESPSKIIEISILGGQWSVVLAFVLLLCVACGGIARDYPAGATSAVGRVLEK